MALDTLGILSNIFIIDFSFVLSVGSSFSISWRSSRLIMAGRGLHATKFAFIIYYSSFWRYYSYYWMSCTNDFSLNFVVFGEVRSLTIKGISPVISKFYPFYLNSDSGTGDGVSLSTNFFGT